MKIKRGKEVVRICEGCGIDFITFQFRVNAGRGRYHSRSCYFETRASTKKDEKIEDIFYQKKCKYGLIKEQYMALFRTQNNKCAICETSFDNIQANVDHCHATGIVRGLLCTHCNTMLGSSKDTPGILRRASEYLLAFSSVR